MKKSLTKGNEMGRKILQEMRHFWQNEQGMGTVEIVLIVVVLIGLVILFKDTIKQVVSTALSNISKNAETVGKQEKRRL